MADTKRKVGRPRKAPEDKKTYKMMAVRPETHENIKKLSKRHKLPIVDWLDMIVNKLK